MRAHTRLGRILDTLSAGMMVLAMLSLAAMALLMNVEIVERSFFKSSTMIADEYSGYFFCWMVLCALTHVQRCDGLLKVSILTDRLPTRLASLLDGLAAVICGSITMILAWATWEAVASSWAFGSTSLSTAQTPLFIPQCIMPVGLVIVTISFFETAYTRFTGRTHPDMERQGSVI